MAKMTVSLMISALQKLPPEAEIEVAVMTTNQRYPRAYVGIDSTVDRHGYEEWIREGPRNCARLYISLEDGYSISVRKK